MSEEAGWPDGPSGGAGRGGRIVRGVVAGVAALGTLALGGCERGSEASDGDRVRRWDSAGVRIVQSVAPVWSAGEGWTVDPEPTLVVGAVDGPVVEAFGFVVDALHLADGGLAVADNQAAAVRLFGPDGRYRATLGGPGEGPGELGFLSALWRRGVDTLVAYDRGGSQLELYALGDGAFAEGRRVHSTGAVLGLADDGTPMTLVFLDDLSALSGMVEPRYGVVLGYEPRDTLATVSGGQQYWREVNGRNVRGLIPFGREFASTGRWGRLAAGAGLRDVTVLDPGGDAPVRRVRWAARRRPIGDGDVEAFFDAMAEASPEAAERARRSLDRVAVPDSMPVHDALALGSDGTLWVERYAPDWEASGRWDVFDAEGAWLGPVDLPPELRVLEVGTDWVLGMVSGPLACPGSASTRCGNGDPEPPHDRSTDPLLREAAPLGLDFIRRTYEAWGAEDPFYAVLTQRSKKGGKWDPEAFFRRGRKEVAEVMRYLGRVEGAAPGRDRALDFGCGVGRLTQALAEHFDEVVGVDISSSMVERARDFNRHGERVTYRVNAEPDLALLDDDRFDLVYSNITLQHIPPRYIRRYVPEFFRVLRPGGVALFQMRHGPAVRPGSLRHWLYRLNREHLRHLLQRLAGRPPYEIHYMARSQMEALIEEGGGRLVEVVDTDGRGKSFRYCAVAG